MTLLQAIGYFKDRDGVIDKHAPLDSLEPTERAAVVGIGNQVRSSLYKVFLFRHIQKAVKSGMLNLKHSYKYRALDDYLISRERWQRDKETLLERAGILEFVDAGKVINALDSLLYQQYKTTNQHLQSGENSLVRFNKNGSVIITTPKREEVDTEPLQGFFPERRYVPLLEALSTVARHSGFLDDFQHWQQRYGLKPPHP